MIQDTFLDRARSRAGGKRCPDCGTRTCFPLKFWNAVIPNRLICECGRVVDGRGQRIRRRVVR